MNLLFMITVQTKIPDCIIYKPEFHKDKRGGFFELWNSNDVPIDWKQVNCSISKKNVVRGIHVAPYAKLVTCLYGHIWDVVVDLRKDSPTYMQWLGVNLKYPQRKEQIFAKQILVPPGCGHQ